MRDERIIKINKSALDNDPVLCAKLRKASAEFYEDVNEASTDALISECAEIAHCTLKQSDRRKIRRKLGDKTSRDEVMKAVLDFIEMKGEHNA